MVLPQKLERYNYFTTLRKQIFINEQILFHKSNWIYELDFLEALGKKKYITGGYGVGPYGTGGIESGHLKTSVGLQIATFYINFWGFFVFFWFVLFGLIFKNNCNSWYLSTFIAFAVTICTKCSILLLGSRLKNSFVIPDNCSLNIIIIPKYYFLIVSFSIVPLFRVTFFTIP